MDKDLPKSSIDSDSTIPNAISWGPRARFPRTELETIAGPRAPCFQSRTRRRKLSSSGFESRKLWCLGAAERRTDENGDRSNRHRHRHLPNPRVGPQVRIRVRTVRLDWRALLPDPFSFLFLP